MKLEKLTEEQEIKMVEVREFWLDYINSCKNSVNKEQAKIGIDWLYKGINKKAPTVFFVASPIGCQIAVHYLKELERANVWANVGANVGDNVWANVGANVWANVRDNVRANVGDNVGANVWDNVRANVGDNVGANVWANVWANVGDNVWANVGANVRANVWANVWANVGANVWANFKYESFSQYGSISDYGWVSFYDFFTQIGVINHEGFNQFKNLISSGVYDMIQMEGVCVVSDLPSKLLRNSDQQMHCVDGYAIEFKDGYGQYYINGRSMPNWVFELYNTEAHSENFLKEENEDVKAGVITMIKERGGQTALLDFLKAEMVDEKIVTHFEGYSETIRLYKTKEKYSFLQDRNGNMNQPYCWSEFTCPSTKSVYLIDNSADFTCAKEAAEFLRPSFVPEGLEYKWEHSAN